MPCYFGISLSAPAFCCPGAYLLEKPLPRELREMEALGGDQGFERLAGGRVEGAGLTVI